MSKQLINIIFLLINSSNLYAQKRIIKIDLGNYHHTFIEIKSRKINQTKYLDKMKELLLRYIEKSDE